MGTVPFLHFARDRGSRWTLGKRLSAVAASVWLIPRPLRQALNSSEVSTFSTQEVRASPFGKAGFQAPCDLYLK